MDIKRFMAFIKANLWQCVLSACGLILGILLLTIGLIKTLIIAAAVVICGLIGHLADKRALNGLKKHKWLFIMGSVGLLIAVLMLTIGFFKTLLICLLTVALGGFGFLVDKAGFNGARALILGFFKRK